ncbi:MAG: hypothetical protein KKC46_10945 [Proteobacteria bacterium]|nr:hypothetical protein [Pseudomonadota bacterium]
MQRPSKREIHLKIKRAKAIVEQVDILIIEPDVIAEDAIELGYRIESLESILMQILDELEIQHYAGDHPPQRSYEREIINSELFAFKWKSKRLGCKVYLKFCIKNDKFYLVSLHKDRV